MEWLGAIRPAAFWIALLLITLIYIYELFSSLLKTSDSIHFIKMIPASNVFDWYNSCETEKCPLAVNWSYLPWVSSPLTILITDSEAINGGMAPGGHSCQRFFGEWLVTKELVALWIVLLMLQSFTSSAKRWLPYPMFGKEVFLFHLR